MIGTEGIGCALDDVEVKLGTMVGSETEAGRVGIWGDSEQQDVEKIPLRLVGVIGSSEPTDIVRPQLRSET